MLQSCVLCCSSRPADSEDGLAYATRSPQATPASNPSARSVTESALPTKPPANADPAPALVQIQDLQLDVQVIGSIYTSRPTLVFLHEGLGCIALWRAFPRQLAERTGLPALVYSRRGYGRSQGFGEELQPGFMHDEARQVLPALL